MCSSPTLATYDTSQVLLARGGPDNLLPHLIIPDHLIAVSDVGSSPTRRTCKTSQVLLAGVSDGFSRGSPVSAPPADWRVPYELKNLERDDKLNKIFGKCAITRRLSIANFR